MGVICNSAKLAIQLFQTTLAKIKKKHNKMPVKGHFHSHSDNKYQYLHRFFKTLFSPFEVEQYAKNFIKIGWKLRKLCLFSMCHFIILWSPVANWKLPLRILRFKEWNPRFQWTLSCMKMVVREIALSNICKRSKTMIVGISKEGFSSDLWASNDLFSLCVLY